MGTLFSCVFRAIELVTGTDTPPDPGGDTDPGGGCLDANNNGICDDEEDDGCDEEASYYQCSFNNQPTLQGGGSCVPEFVGSFSKQELIDANTPGITDCSQEFPPQILVNGEPAFLSPGADNCCVTVDYYFCENPLVECPDEGCEPTPIEFNSRSELDTPGQVNGVPDTPGGTGYKNEQDCENLPCCTNPPPDLCYVAKCFQGSQVNTNVDASIFGGTCPTGPGIVLGTDGIYYVAANGGGTLLCICSDFICDTDDDSCKQRTQNLDGNPNNVCPPADGYPTLAQCQADETNECCRRYDPDSPGVFDPNNNFNQDISNALTASYSFINSLDSSQGNVITVCPDIQNYRFTIGDEPGSVALPPTLLDYEKTIAGGPGVVIDPGNGNITVSIADIPENGASYTVTFTRNCGDPNGIDQGSIVFNLAPDDFYTCFSDQNCLDNGVQGCDFADPDPPTGVSDATGINIEPGPLAKLTLFQGPPFRDFDTAFGGSTPSNPELMGVTPNVIPRFCNPEGTTYMDVEGIDAEGNVITDLIISNVQNFTSGMGSFVGQEPSPNDPNRIRIHYSLIAGGASSLPMAAFDARGGGGPNRNFALWPFDLRTFNSLGTTLPKPNPNGCGDDGSDPGGFGSGGETEGLPPNTGRSSDDKTSSIKLFRSRDTDAIANPNATSDYLKSLETRKASEKLFDPVVSNKRPGPRQRVPYIPVRNTGFSKNLFGTFIDYRISLIRDYYNNQDEDDAEDYSEFIFADLTLQNIERSLKPSVRNLLNDKKTIEGVPLRNRVLQKIKDLIIKDELQYYKVEQVVDMVTNTSNEQENFKRFTTFQTNQQVVDIVENSPTLDPNEYTGLDKQRVTYWKTIAPDLQKNISVVNEDLSVDQVEVKLDDTVDILAADGVTTCSISITDFDTLEVSTHVGTLFPITLDTQIARSKVPNFEDLTRIFSLLKETYDFKVMAKSEATDKIEEDADLDSERRPFYFFQLDPSTVVDLDRRNPLIRLSQCKYILRTGEQKIKDWVETKPYPFYNLYVNHNDLFIDHMFKSRELTLEFKDISLDSFSTFGDDYPIIPRRIPWYIVVIPSDRSDIMSSAGVSKLENYNTRVMYFNISPDTNRYKQKWDTSILKENQGEAFQNSQDGSIVVENYNFQYDSTKVDTEIKPYIGGSEPLPRRAPATRALFKAMRELKSSADSFIDSQGTTVAWGSVYQKMTRQEKKSLALVDSLNFQDLRSKILRGEPSDDASVNAEFTKVSEVTNQNIRNLNEFKTTVFKKISVDPGAVATPELLGE
jgi:hypothetical protein